MLEHSTFYVFDRVQVSVNIILIRETTKYTLTGVATIINCYTIIKTGASLHIAFGVSCSREVRT